MYTFLYLFTSISSQETFKRELNVVCINSLKHRFIRMSVKHEYSFTD